MLLPCSVHDLTDILVISEDDLVGTGAVQGSACNLFECAFTIHNQLRFSQSGAAQPYSLFSICSKSAVQCIAHIPPAGNQQVDGCASQQTHIRRRHRQKRGTDGTVLGKDHTVACQRVAVDHAGSVDLHVADSQRHVCVVFNGDVGGFRIVDDDLLILEIDLASIAPDELPLGFRDVPGELCHVIVKRRRALWKRAAIDSCICQVHAATVLGKEFCRQFRDRAVIKLWIVIIVRVLAGAGFRRRETAVKAGQIAYFNLDSVAPIKLFSRSVTLHRKRWETVIHDLVHIAVISVDGETRAGNAAGIHQCLCVIRIIRIDPIIRNVDTNTCVVAKAVNIDDRIIILVQVYIAPGRILTFAQSIVLNYYISGEIQPCVLAAHTDCSSGSGDVLRVASCAKGGTPGVCKHCRTVDRFIASGNDRSQRGSAAACIDCAALLPSLIISHNKGIGNSKRAAADIDRSAAARCGFVFGHAAAGHRHIAAARVDRSAIFARSVSGIIFLRTKYRICGRHCAGFGINCSSLSACFILRQCSSCNGNRTTARIDRSTLAVCGSISTYRF